MKKAFQASVERIVANRVFVKSRDMGEDKHINR